MKLNTDLERAVNALSEQQSRIIEMLVIHEEYTDRLRNNEAGSIEGIRAAEGLRLLSRIDKVLKLGLYE